METNNIEVNNALPPVKTTIPIKTILLIVMLIGIVAILVNFAFSSKTTPQKTQEKSAAPTKKVDVAHTELSFSPASLNVPLSSNSSSLDINIDTKDNKVTGVQLEISYDPKVLGNVKLTPVEGKNAFLGNPLVLYNKTDSEKGEVSLILGIPPSSEAKNGTGTVAVLSFNVLNRTSKETQVSFLPGTIVTAVGINSSVLKTSSNAKIVLSSQ